MTKLKNFDFWVWPQGVAEPPPRVLRGGVGYLLRPWGGAGHPKPVLGGGIEGWARVAKPPNVKKYIYIFYYLFIFKI
jgi:hypothetical protein